MARKPRISISGSLVRTLVCGSGLRLVLGGHSRGSGKVRGECECVRWVQLARLRRRSSAVARTLWRDKGTPRLTKRKTGEKWPEWGWLRSFAQLCAPLRSLLQLGARKVSFVWCGWRGAYCEPQKKSVQERFKRVGLSALFRLIPPFSGLFRLLVAGRVFNLKCGAEDSKAGFGGQNGFAGPPSPALVRQNPPSPAFWWGSFLRRGGKAGAI